ncbi:MAG: MltA domain-containing protein [Sulfurimonas sp.]|nr:MltA domain-containing protein [Sulfurimonas sp.]
MYTKACKKAIHSSDAKAFIHKEFSPYKITTSKGKEEGLLTGYYEPELRGSLKKDKKV